MLSHSRAFSGFSTNDVEAARAFYADALGLDASIDEMGILTLNLSGGQRVIVYPKDDHQPASYTVLNFEVTDIDAAVDQLADAGITLERYEGSPQDERGIVRAWGPPVAWFTDPGGNILSVIQSG